MQWRLRAVRARDFGKRYSILPPEADPDPVPNPLAEPPMQIDARQVRVELCIHGHSAPFSREFELAIGCEVLEFWNVSQKAEGKPELSSLELFGPAEQIHPNPPMPTRKTKQE